MVNLDVYFYLAQIYIQQKKFVKAIHFLKEIIRDYPDFKEVLSNLAFSYYSIGKLDKAQEIYQDLKSKYPYEPLYDKMLETIKI
jgi:tetratricopeptide (TPR) repeat protein